MSLFSTQQTTIETYIIETQQQTIQAKGFESQT
jgi:hypothetical protein